MENNSEQPVNPPPPIQQPPANEIPHSGGKFKLILLIAILLLVIGAAVYLLGINQGKILSQYFQRSTPTIIPLSPTPIPGPTANWRTYVSSLYNPFWTEEQLQKTKPGDGYATPENIKKIKISVTCPPDWILEEASDSASKIWYGNNFSGIKDAKIYKGDFEIRIGFYYAPGGNLCNTFPSKYEEIASFAPLQRFSVAKDEQIKPGFTKFYICSKEGASYGSVTSIGQISYLVPNTFKPSDITLMNSIVKTIKKIVPSD